MALNETGKHIFQSIKEEYVTIAGAQGALKDDRAVILGGGVSGVAAAARLLSMGIEKVTITDIQPSRVETLKDMFAEYGERVQVLLEDKDINNPSAQLLAAYKEADYLYGCILVPGTQTPQMSTELLAEISEKSKSLIVDIALDQGGNFPDAYSRHYDDPAYVDEFGNVRFSVPNMPLNQ